MHWSSVEVSGAIPESGIRAHSTTRKGSHLYIFGGCNNASCFQDMLILDSETLHFFKPQFVGDVPGPHRAHTATLVGENIWVFGGGDGPNYFNDLYVLDTNKMSWSKPQITGTAPGPRRAHTATLVGTNKIYMFGGGDGNKALNEIYVLDTDEKKWTKFNASGTLPPPRGYHTACAYANNSGNKIVVYGGSDGHQCFNDVHVLDIEKQKWIRLALANPYSRLAHTANSVGPWMMVFGGHDGQKYVNDLSILDLESMMWVNKPVNGTLPSPRGYHTCDIYNSRLFIIGGFNGESCFPDVCILDLAGYAYLPQQKLTWSNLPQTVEAKEGQTDSSAFRRSGPMF